MGILQVHQKVADIVGSLDQPNQGIAYIFERLTGFGQANNAQFIGDFGKYRSFAVKESELVLAVGQY